MNPEKTLKVVLKELRKLGICLANGSNGKDLCSSIANIKYHKSLFIELINREDILDIESMASPLKYLERLYLAGNLKNLPDWISSIESLVRMILTRSNLIDDPMRVVHVLPNLLGASTCGCIQRTQVWIMPAVKAASNWK
ncbi:hypothetical protein JRO89_XS06G0253300 [Xanthoceras sorbifolium]|uniref:Uncharacterized protein n=1 Tax=Xanthoceras sorbifolium TaxID=99658 RepID=A0ABQ8HZF9_9ROSI|nr:hypothetical protein JRO89_XS06G0253300 [Xanthoceras sorbifolium]